MNRDKQFSLENLLMSVIGHLVFVAIVVTSFAVLVNRSLLIAPDRIQITEIDLDLVNISFDDTKLYNTNPIEDTKPDVKNEPVSEPEPTPTPDATKKELETPSMVDPEPETKTDTKPEPAPEPNKVEPMPAAPKKKAVIRVNRESVSLNRTLNLAAIDALRIAMTRCWVFDRNRPDISDIRAVAHLTMRKNGTVRDVWFEQSTRAETDPGFAYILNTIRAAINTCQPLRMLPANDFAKWEKITLTFYPTSGKVM